ncbi:hypothetical protein BV20DRAFT_1116695 [Pilatotrama ljubarskyi]|nr:hypothetical protein BV20DRAFT_1116695 [Pilatotrama ljubarskyi]
MAHTRQLVPLEVIYHIMDYLEDDLSALRSCAITNKALLSCARANMYRNIRLVGHAYRQSQLLSRTLRAEPTLGSLVRSLRISGLIAPHTSTGSELYLTPDVLPFHLLHELRELTLHWMQLRRVDDLVAIVATLPALERLACDTLVDDSSAELPLEHAATRAAENILQRPRPDPALFPRLKELLIKHGPWNHSAFAKTLLLSHRVAIESLQLIDISFGGTAEALAWVPVIGVAGPRLQSLSISMTDRSSRHAEQALPLDTLEQYDSDHAYVLDTVANCPSLRFLRLKYLPDAFAALDAPPSPAFLETLCEVFERRPPPFPAFEHLDLWMVDRGGRAVSSITPLITRLSHSLLDRRHYMHFCRLSVRIQPQSWIPHLRMWSTRYRQGQGAKQDMLERWRATFAPFEEAAGVVLHVDFRQSSRPA